MLTKIDGTPDSAAGMLQNEKDMVEGQGRTWKGMMGMR